MNIEINIKKYLNTEEIQEECRQAIRFQISQLFKTENDIDRLISNLSYEFIFKAIEESTGKDQLQKIKDTVAKLVSKESTISYELFKQKDAWSRSEAVGLKVLHEAINENVPLIKEKVKEAIGNYDFLSRKDLQTRMEDLFHEMLEEKLFHNFE